MDGWTCWADAAPEGHAIIEWHRPREGFDAYIHKERASEVAATLAAHRADPANVFWRHVADNVIPLHRSSSPGT
jgi:hypothetical protein